MEREALKLALEALGWADGWRPQGLKDKAIAAIKEALAQPAQEPVAVLFQDGSIVKLEDLEFVPEKSGQRVQMLYTPPQRPWVGLTEKEKKEIHRLSVYVEGAISLTEAKLKEKNNGA